VQFVTIEAASEQVADSQRYLSVVNLIGDDSERQFFTGYSDNVLAIVMRYSVGRDG